jgi:hypothetical protein
MKIAAARGISLAKALRQDIEGCYAEQLDDYRERHRQRFAKLRANVVVIDLHARICGCFSGI